MLMILFFWLCLPQLMLNTCCQFANDHNLLFNPGKTQLVWFSLPSSSPNPSTSPTFLFAGQSLQLLDRACHLAIGHILRSDLSDTDVILRVQTDMCRRANCPLSTFYAANPVVKTTLFCSFCLSRSLYGSALWRLSSSSLRSLSIICWGKFGSFRGNVILVSFTALVVFKASLMLLFIVQVSCVRKQEILEFL